MTDKRPLTIGLLALVAVLALGAAFVFEFSRGGQMRSSEADFMARMEEEGRTLPRYAPAAAVRSARKADPALSDWYGATDPGVTNPTGNENPGMSTEPEDNSFLIDDTRPAFGADESETEVAGMGADTAQP